MRFPHFFFFFLFFSFHFSHYVTNTLRHRFLLYSGTIPQPLYLSPFLIWHIYFVKKSSRILRHEFPWSYREFCMYLVCLVSFVPRYSYCWHHGIDLGRR